MRIQHNIAALNTHRSMKFNNTQANKTLEKLSSGYKINRAGDDAAGLAISEKMRGQIRGLNMAQKNAQDGISLIQTAEGAMHEVHALLQRGRELAVQAANDTNVESDRAAIQLELEEIKKEVNRIGTDTEFNTLKLLQGSGTQSLSEEDLTKLEEQVRSFLEGAEDMVFATYGIGPAQVKDMELQFIGKDKGNSLAWVVSYVNSTTGIAQQWEMAFDTMDYTGDPSQETSLGLTTLHEMTHAMMSASGINWKDSHNPKWFKEGTAEYMTGGMDRLIIDLKIQGGVANFDSDSNIEKMLNRIDGAASDSAFYSASYATTRYLDDWLKDTSRNSSLDAVLQSMQATQGTLDEAIQATTGGATFAQFKTDLKGSSGIAAIKGYITAGGIGSATGQTTDVALIAAIKGITIDESDHFRYDWDGNSSSNTLGSIILHIGANEEQNIKVGLPNISSFTVGIQDADVTTQQTANDSITLFDTGIQYVSKERSALGAIQNRLEHTINNLGTSSENLTAAESRIRDTDMAKEMMKFTKDNILMQAAQSMLSQANQHPQMILQLLA